MELVMSELDGFERIGIEQLANDYSEVALSLAFRRDIDRDMVALDRLLVTFEAMTEFITHEKQVRASRDELANSLVEKVFGIESETVIVDNQDSAGFFNIIPEFVAEQVDEVDAITPPEINDTYETELTEQRAAADSVSALFLSEPVEVQKPTTESTEIKSPSTLDSRNVDWEELEVVLKDVLADFSIGDELKPAVFYKQPYFKNMIGGDGKGLAKAKSRFKKGIDRLVKKGILEHNGKIKRQSAYILVEMPEITEKDKTFLDI